MKFFDGLYSYEIVLLVLGVVLFVVLLIVFVRQVFRGKSYAGLLPFFVVPVAMIGYPSIKSIEIDKDTVKIEKQTRALTENPTDAAARDALKKAMSGVAVRPIADARRLAALASAQFALGDESAATANVQKAQRVDPTAPDVSELQRKIAVLRDLERLTAAVETHPNDSHATAELSRTLSEATKARFANPKALTAIARAQVVVGDRANALENVDKALAIDPHSQAAHEVKGRIGATTIHPPPGQ